MVERGGLNYPIKVPDEFSANTKLFRQEIGAAKKAFRSFQAELRNSKSATKAVRDQARAAKDLAKSQFVLGKARASAGAPLAGLDRFEKKRLRTIRNLKDQTKLLGDVEVRRSRDAKRTAAAAEKQASAVERQAAANKAAAKAAKEAERAERKLADLRATQARSSNLSANRDEAKQRTNELRRLKESILERERIKKTDIKDAERAKKDRQRVDPRFQAQKQLNAELFKEQIIREKIGLLRAQARMQFARGDLVGGAETLKRAKALERSLKGSAKAGQKLLFTFRRLVGTLAIFTLARKGVQVFNELVSSGIRFNDTIETSTLGIAGLVATLADVRDELGQSVGKAEELDLALGLARTQIELLRQDSLKTVATFTQLLDTFQVAVGPGLAAGLNLDEVRQLTVSISQAAAALSVPQNQLAEEIRSLLAGTIQARTTRIATALGITNSDIRRLKEAGELFEFLDERLAGFAESAQRAARETITGLRAILKGAFEALVGEAAKPLFDELISLGNQLLDNVLTVSDALGNLRPNPKAVAVLRPIFETLKVMLQAAVDVGKALGFEGAETLISGLAAGFQVLAEALRVILTGLIQLIRPFTFIREQLGLAKDEAQGLNKDLGGVLGVVGLLIIAFKVLKTKVAAMVLKAVPAAAVFFGIAAAVKFIVDAIFDVDLSIRQVIQLVALGFFGAMIKISEVVRTIGELVGSAIGGALDSFISNARIQALKASRFIGALFGASDRTQQRLANKQFAEEQKKSQEKSKREKELAVELADIKDQALARQLAVEQEIGDIIAKATKNAIEKAPGFDPSAAARKAAEDAAKLLEGIASTADKPINDLSADLLKLSDNLRETRSQFKQGFAATGVGGDIQEIFREEELVRGEKLRAINDDIRKTRENLSKLQETDLITQERALTIQAAASIEDLDARKKALKGLNLTKEETLLVSLLRDEVDLTEGLLVFQKQSLDLAIAKAAVFANDQLPSLREEVSLLRAEAAGVQAVAALRAAGASDQTIALATSRAAVAQAKVELDIQRQRAVDSLTEAGAGAVLARERAVAIEKELSAKTDITQKDRDQLLAAQQAADLAEDILGPLAERLQLEDAIALARQMSLDAALAEADLVANGDLTQGLKEGFTQFAEEFSSVFNAGLQIARQGTMALAQFISQSITEAFDPTNDTTLKERFGRFLQQISQIILQQLIQVAIAAGIQRIGIAAVEKNAELAADAARNLANLTFEAELGALRIGIETQIAFIRAASAGAGGGHEGGLVGRGVGFHDGGAVAAGVRGYALGGPVTGSSSSRPRGLHPADTIKAFLAPGEFVMRRAAVESIGLSALNAMNNGPSRVVGGADSAGAGFQDGGLVSDRPTERSDEQDAPLEEQASVVMVPAVVATDRELDQLLRGGSNALFEYMRENAGDINLLLDRNAGR